MQATPEEIDALLEVQRIDLDSHAIDKRLEELPQRGVILGCRQKRDAIGEKLSQVVALRKEASKKLTRINDEDASLEKKENGVQAAIEAAGNDFRNVEARTKELNGIFRRRGELAENRQQVEGEMKKIETLESQVKAALADLDAAEAKAVESFKSEGGALMQALADNKAKREQLLSKVGRDVADFYTKVSAHFDTVSIGKLEGSSCGVCRAKIEQGRLLDLMTQAPLGLCPSCKRILIISED